MIPAHLRRLRHFVTALSTTFPLSRGRWSEECPRLSCPDTALPPYPLLLSSLSDHWLPPLRSCDFCAREEPLLPPPSSMCAS